MGLGNKPPWKAEETTITTRRPLVPITKENTKEVTS